MTPFIFYLYLTLGAVGLWWLLFRWRRPDPWAGHIVVLGTGERFVIASSNPKTHTLTLAGRLPSVGADGEFRIEAPQNDD